MKPARTKTIATKLSIDEYAELEHRAGNKTLSEWVREQLLKPAAPRPLDVTLLGEVIAVRTILLNVLYRLANGERISVETMQQLISRADAEKSQRAVEQLAAKVGK